ncbi:hypothetical protein AJ88_20920 [Mesorhizobium amorphae CCBAU 01583]|nr:hypothetical protein AJ88_20920 [Mesorhizobium amorphae CCBAU 01583]
MDGSAYTAVPMHPATVLTSLKGKALPVGLACHKLRRDEHPQRLASVRPPLTFVARGGRLTGDHASAAGSSASPDTFLGVHLEQIGADGLRKGWAVEGDGEVVASLLAPKPRLSPRLRRRRDGRVRSRHLGEDQPDF